MSQKIGTKQERKRGGTNGDKNKIEKEEKTIKH
jgi:hypothetical protein